MKEHILLIYEPDDIAIYSRSNDDLYKLNLVLGEGGGAWIKVMRFDSATINDCAGCITQSDDLKELIGIATLEVL